MSEKQRVVVNKKLMVKKDKTAEELKKIGVVYEEHMLILKGGVKKVTKIPIDIFTAPL